MKFRARSLADGLLSWLRVGGVGIVFMAVCSTGCLLPQDDFPIDLPPRDNRPPRIIEQLVTPSARRFDLGNIEVAPRGCDVTFEAAFEDWDIQDVLYVYWSIDGELLKQSPSDKFGPASPNIHTSRRVLSTASGPLAASGTHVVEMLLTDGFLFNRIPEPETRTAPDGTEYQITRYATSYAWTVVVKNETCKAAE